MKQQITLNESQLREMIEKCVRESLGDIITESNEFDGNDINEDVYYDVMDACSNLVITNQYAARSFNRKNIKTYEAQDPEFAELKRELIGSLQSVFENSKMLLRYCHDKSNNDFTKKDNAKYLSKEFTPEW